MVNVCFVSLPCCWVMREINTSLRGNIVREAVTLACIYNLCWSSVVTWCVRTWRRNKMMKEEWSEAESAQVALEWWKKQEVRQKVYKWHWNDERSRRWGRKCTGDTGMMKEVWGEAESVQVTLEWWKKHEVRQKVYRWHWNDERTLGRGRKWRGDTGITFIYLFTNSHT
jgi:precorrin-6B methylase 2